MATTFNLNGGTVFPEGTSVGAYPRSAWGVESVSGAPTGSATATATVTSGVAAFTGLTTNTQYYAYASVSGQPRIKSFNTADPPTSGGTPGNDSLTTAMLQDGAVTARKMADVARTGGWLPTGAIAQTLPGRQSSNSNNLTSGTLRLVGGLVIPGGRTVSSITFVTGATGATTPTNQWFCIVDQSRNVLATTVDDTTTVWNGTAAKTLALATTIGGSTPGGTYTPANAIEVYLGVCVVAATAPSLTGFVVSTAAAGLAPVISGNSSVSLTTPGSAPATLAALTTQAHLAWAYVS